MCRACVGKVKQKCMLPIVNIYVYIYIFPSSLSLKSLKDLLMESQIDEFLLLFSICSVKVIKWDKIIICTVRRERPCIQQRLN